MAKLRITNKDKNDFKNTKNGAKKAIWLLVGMLLDFLATLGISLLHIFSNKIPNQLYFLGILFVLLVIVVLGGEMIGVYYGALEQYVYEKNKDNIDEDNTNKKVLDINE